MWRYLWVFFRIIFIVILPFVVLIRGAVFLHEDYGLYPSLAILGGFVFTAVVLLIYLAFFFGAPRRSIRPRLQLVALILLAYGAYALMYVSAQNVKSAEVAKEFTSLHPVLRLGVSTLILADGSLVITDANRLPEDYRKMGLARKSHSLHYTQSSGYAHAIDIRTAGRSGIRIFVTKWYFKAMGFNVVRHGGTGDHLHISLLSHDSPHAY